jgi:hypothetical protein
MESGCRHWFQNLSFKQAVKFRLRIEVIEGMVLPELEEMIACHLKY